MNSLLKNIDIYGIQIPFTFYGKTQYTSPCGGTLTLITLFLVLFLTIHEMAPIYYRQDPQLFDKMIDPEKYSYYNLSYKNFPIAFRFEDESKTIKNLDGIVYTYIDLIHLKLNKTTGNMFLHKHKQISFSDCTEDLISRNSYTNLNGFKCLNYSEFDEKVGGAIYAEDSIYFKITVFFCAMVDGQPQNCTDFKTLSKELSGKKKIYFTILIPDVSINPDEYDDPLKITLDAYINTLSPLIMRTDRYYYNYMKMERDGGLVFDDIRTLEGFTFYRKDVEYQIRTEQDYEDPNKIKTLSTNVFAIEKRIYNLKVVFKRLQSGLADIGGLIKIFTMSFVFLNRFIMDYFKFFRLIDDLFEVKIDKGKVQKIFNNKGDIQKLNDKIKNQMLKDNKINVNKSDNLNAWSHQNDNKDKLLKGLYIDISGLKINEAFNKNKLVLKRGINMENNCIDSSKNSDSYLQKNNVNKNNLTAGLDKRYNKDLLGTNNLDNKLGHSDIDNNRFKEQGLVNINLVNIDSKIEKLDKEPIYDNNDKSSFRDKESINENQNMKNKDLTQSNNISGIDLKHDMLKELNFKDSDLIKKSNIPENQEQVLDKIRGFKDSFDYYVLSIKDIFDYKEKIKLLLFKRNSSVKNNFKIYYDGQQKIAEKMDIINYLKMSFKFEEVVESLDDKNIKSTGLNNFGKELIYLD